MAIGSAELPLPKPIGLPASKVHEPSKTLQSCGYGCRQIMKGHECQGGCPSTFLVISGQGRPASILVLALQEKFECTFSVACGYRRAEGERAVARRLNRWLRRGSKCSPPSAG